MDINFYPVMMTDFRLVRGMQNDFLFQMRDIDRKPVRAVDGQTATICIRDGNHLLMQRELTLLNPAKGIFQLTIFPAELDAWPLGALDWSMLTDRGEGNVMLWTDRNYTPTGTIQVTHAPFPGPYPTVILNAGDLTPDVQSDGTWFRSVALPGAVQNGFADGMHTFFLDLAGFTGVVQVERADQQAGPWSLLAENDYLVPALQDVIDEEGDYQWLRISFLPLDVMPYRVLYKR